MKQHTNRIFYIVLPICVLLCLCLWLLKTPPASMEVEAQNGVWDLRDVDLNETSAELTGHPEYVLNALLTPEGFAASGEVQSGPIPDGTDYLTFRFRILVPDDQMVALAGYCAGNASRIYINGQLLGGAGVPGETKETIEASNRYLSVTATPANSVIEIVEQSSNFVHKDGGFWPALKFYAGSEQAISDWITRFNAFPVIEIGIYLLLFVVHLLLFLTLPSYRANLWLSLLSLTWALRTGVIGTKVWLALFPWLTWSAAFRIEYLAIPATLLLLMLSYRELFLGVIQKGFCIAVYGFSALLVIFILTADTMLLSFTGVPMTAFCSLIAAYVLARILWKTRRPNTEQRIILAGLGMVTLAIIADVLYFNTSTSEHIPGSMMETALILFSLFQMTAMLHATMRETAAAKEAEQRLAVEAEALRRLNQAKEDFLGDLSHELKMPITVISGFAQYSRELLSDTPPDLAELSGSADRIELEAERMERLVGQLLDLSAIESGTFRLRRAEYPVRELLGKIESTYFAMTDDAGNRLSVDCPDELVIRADGERILQVLINLVSNASRHTRDGEINLSAQRLGKRTLFAVSDTGEGVPAHLLAKLFTRYPHRDEKGERSGSGLGLTIAKKIVEAHGGEIGIESEEDRGTRVWFTIPTEGYDS